MRLHITTNIAKLAKEIDHDARDQVPFAIALALTRTAKDVQQRLVGTLGDFFQVRGTWVARSIRIDKAKKGPAPFAVVGSLYEPMELQAEGGEKTGKGDVAVPVAARADKTAKTSPAKWPGQLLTRKGFFLRESPEGAAIYQRIGRGGRNLKLWWLLEPSVEVEPRWPFEGIAEETVQREVADNFCAAMEQALRTRR